MQALRSSTRKTRGVPPVRYRTNTTAANTMATPDGSFHGFGSSSSSNGDALNPDVTIIQQGDPMRTSTPSDEDETSITGSGQAASGSRPPHGGIQQQHTYGGEVERNLTNMCDIISNLDRRLFESQRHSEQREKAMVQRLLELEHRLKSKSDSHHDNIVIQHRESTSSIPSDISPAVLNNNNTCTNASNKVSPAFRSSATTTDYAQAAHNNNTVYTQSHESNPAASTHVVYTSGLDGAARTSAAHSREHMSSSTIIAPTHVRPAHVYPPASWAAASMHVPSSFRPALFASAHADRHVHQPVPIQPEGYFVQMPQSVPPLPSYPHSASPWPAYAASQPHSNPAAAYGPVAVVRRPEHRRLYDLPPFTGLPEDWPKFEQAFHSTTESYGYDNVDNLMRLQKSLSGEAERAVESLLIHPGHVQLVMETLSDTFGHPDLLIRSQIERARRLPQVHEAHLEMLVPFANAVRNVATYLDAPTTQHHLTNPILLEELVSKLPGPRRVDWAAVATQIRPYATVRDFSVWISGVARLVRHAYPASIASKPTSSQSSAAGRINTRSQATKRVLLSATNIDEIVQRSKCSYCKKEHDTEHCYWFKRLSSTERWRVVREGAWCYGCLADSHILPSCGVKRKCSVGGCPEWHHSVLHERGEAVHRPSFNEDACGRKPQGEAKQKHRRRATYVQTTSAPSKVSTPSDSTTTRDIEKSPTDMQQAARVCTVQQRALMNTLLFRVMPIVLHANGRSLHTYALFDIGSSVSLIDNSLVDEMGLEGPEADLKMQWFGRQTTVLRSRKVALEISGSSQSDKKYQMHLRTIRNLSLPTQSVDLETLYVSNPHLRDVPFESYNNAVPRVLIGLDNHHLGIEKEIVCSDDEEGLIASRSKLGWTVYGCDGPAYLPNAMVLAIHGERDEEYELLNEMVRSFITSEDFGVRTPKAAIESDDDIRARSILQQTTRRVGDRFETGLLWRKDDISLPPSYDMALRRLINIESRMRRDPKFGEQYAAQINAYLSKGYARKLSVDELQRQDSHTWYLPHFAVVNPNKPGKFRLVFDAAAKVEGLSLNSALLSGPDNNVPLARLLFQFRLGEVGVCADIAEMFLQVRVRKEDQAAQRFLWRGGDSSATPEQYAMTVMTFGATCSPSAAQYVKNANADEFRNDFPDAAKAIHCRHYVDDYVASYATPEEAARVSAEVVEVHRRGGFILRGFVSNNRAVLEALGASTGPGDLVDLEPESTFEKILGMTWNTADDTFRFRTRFSRVPEGVLDGNKRPTKRIILSTCMSVFDPYGLLANFILPPKLMVQDMYRMGLDWDEPAPVEICKRWDAWRVEISRTHLLRMPRCPFYDVNAISDVQLHIFADASEAAFAAVAFWRITRGNEVKLSFVAGKVKVSPTQMLSMPRLELSAAVLATRLLDEIRRSHESVQIHKFVLWSDSETVLNWIRSDQRKYKQFVGFRIAEIAESTLTTWWRWVPTAMNVADDGTRIQNPPVFEPNGRWLWGPAWLCDKEETWPKQRDNTKPIELCPEEVRSKYVGVIVLRSFIEFTRFSSFHRLCRSVAWILRFRNNTLSRKRNMMRTQGELSASEVDEGLKQLCKMVQKEEYAREYATLERRKEIDRTSSIFILNPYLDNEGLMRLHGRTDRASEKHLAFDARRPILLPRQHHLTMLMVRSCHQRLAHQLIEATIALVRQRFWVPQLRVLVRNVQQACQKCRVRTATPDTPVQGQLPLDRLTPFVRPFATTGLDYFGPVTVRIGRRREKRWVALFTCMAVRAVHLEIATNLSTDACLLCIRNFINLRGVPNLIRCDNGTNFVGAKNMLNKETGFFDSDAVQRELTTRGIEWKFNRPANPEAGGTWERLVQSVKRVLAVTLRQAAPEVETLRAHLLEAANIINSRPLTHIPVEPEEDEPITPNHFLVGGPNMMTVPDPTDVRSLSSRDQWVKCREMSRQFWTQWIRDYLPELTRRSRHYPPREPLQRGDLVIVCDDGQPRSRWIRGRIAETSMGVDGLIRSAKVRTADGEYWRPTTKLAVLDVSPPRMDSADGARDVAICC